MTLTNHGSEVPAPQRPPDRALLAEQHKISYFKGPGDGTEYKFSCTCGAKWTLGTNATTAQINESFKSHQISVGLKPSEVL